MKTVFWDFDGTIVHSRLLWSRSMRSALEMASSPVLPEIPIFREYTSSFFPWDNPYCDFTEYTGEKWWFFMQERFQSCFCELGVPEDVSHKASSLVRGLIISSESYALYEDTIFALRLVHLRGHRNILLSNNHPDLRKIIRRLGLEPYFDGFVISAEVGFDKPRREIFSATKLLSPGSQEYIMVGDNLAADILGGKDSGMTTVYVHKGFSESADFCFDELSSIEKLL